MCFGGGLAVAVVARVPEATELNQAGGRRVIATGKIYISRSGNFLMLPLHLCRQSLAIMNGWRPLSEWIAIEKRAGAGA